jgi:hypothetical protein
MTYPTYTYFCNLYCVKPWIMDAFHIFLHACSNTFLETSCTFKLCFNFLTFHFKIAILHSFKAGSFYLLTKKCICTKPCRSLIYFEAEACLDIDNQHFSSLLASKIADAAYSRRTGACRDAVGRLAYYRTGAGTQ